MAANYRITRRQLADGTPRYMAQLIVWDGRNRTTTGLGTFGRERDAKDAGKKAVSEWDKGRTLPTGSTRETVEEYLTAWLAQLPASGLKPSTIGTYGWQITRWVIPHLGAVRLRKLSADDVRLWEINLAATGSKTGGSLSKAAVQGARRALSTALEDAIVAGKLASNPTKVGRRKGGTAGKPAVKVNPWSPEEARSFLAATAGTRWHPFWHLALSTGLRRGELLGLEWFDIDLRGGKLRVLRNRVETYGSGVVENTPKGGKGRTISIDADTVAVLQAWKDSQEADRVFAGEGWADTGRVFASALGEVLDPSDVDREWALALKEWGGRRVRLHDLRHTHAYLCIKSGMHPKTLQGRMGHAHIQTTLDIYGHLMDGDDEVAAQKVATLLRGE